MMTDKATFAEPDCQLWATMHQRNAETERMGDSRTEDLPLPLSPRLTILEMKS